MACDVRLVVMGMRTARDPAVSGNFLLSRPIDAVPRKNATAERINLLILNNFVRHISVTRLTPRAPPLRSEPPSHCLRQRWCAPSRQPPRSSRWRCWRWPRSPTVRLFLSVALPCVGLGASGPAFRSVLVARRASLAGAGAGTGRGEGHRAAVELAGWLGALVATGPLSNEACERFG